MEIYSWYLSENSSDVIVWVVDNGVNYYHPDLVNNMWNPSSCLMDGIATGCTHWFDFFHNKSTPLPNVWDHGTHIAWIIGAEMNNGIGTIWVNPYVKIAALKAWNGDILTSAATTKAINFARENWIKVLNWSYWANRESVLEKQAIQAFWEAWGLFIAAAGNEKANMEIEDNKQYPCAYDLDNIICVASVKQSGEFSTRFSNYWVTDVDIAAPWEHILSTSIWDIWEIYSVKYDFESGTISECTASWAVIDGWEWWKCFKWWDSTGYAYTFEGDPLVTPTMNISWRENVYLNLDLACNLTHWAEVTIDFLDNWNIIGSQTTNPLVYNTAYRYLFPIATSQLSDNFRIKLTVNNYFSGVQCVVDNINIYTDPYYSDNLDVYSYLDWTSMAAPFVSWLTSLVWKLNPNLTNSQVKDIILWTGDENVSLSGKVKTQRVINVLKTLNSVPLEQLDNPTWLISSWDWRIAWDPSAPEWNNIGYHYEVINSWNKVVYSWTVVDTGVTLLNFTGDNYTWTIQALSWYKSSEIVTGYICKKPVLNEWVLTGYECSTLIWEADYTNDNCSSQYIAVFESEDWALSNNQVTLNTTWTAKRYVYLKNAFWEETDKKVINFTWKDSPVTLVSTNINWFWGSTITSTSTRSVWNVVSLFWATDWACWSWTITVKSVQCNYGSAHISSNNLTINAPSNSQNTDTSL